MNTKARGNCLNPSKLQETNFIVSIHHYMLPTPSFNSQSIFSDQVCTSLRGWEMKGVYANCTCKDYNHTYKTTFPRSKKKKKNHIHTHTHTHTHTKLCFYTCTHKSKIEEQTYQCVAGDSFLSPKHKKTLFLTSFKSSQYFINKTNTDHFTTYRGNW
jgi:hypothetical protein